MITVEAKRLGTRVIATVKVGISTGDTPIRSNLRIKGVKPRMRSRRNASCVEHLKKSSKLLGHRECKGLAAKLLGHQDCSNCGIRLGLMTARSRRVQVEAYAQR
jgi:hypothetical protein